MHSGDSHYKSRLIDRAHIAAAVDYMLARGISESTVVMELSRHFYVDMDELNAVLTARETPAAYFSGTPVDRIPNTIW